MERNPNRAARAAAALLLALFVVGAPFATCACGEEAQDNEVEIAFQALVDAVGRRDAVAVYAFTTNRVRTFLDQVQHDLAEAERLSRLYFPEWQREKIGERLALHRLAGTKSGVELFGRLVDFDKIREGDAVKAGLEHEPPVIEGDRGTVRTAAGEVFLFVREDGEWRTTAYDAVASLPIVETLQTNVEILRENVRRLKELYASANDPRAPEGAFNELRDALANGDGRIVLTLLDEPGRKALGALREVLATTDPKDEAARKERLAAAGLADLDLKEATASDRKLAVALTKDGKLGELVGIDKSSAIHLVTLASRSEASVVTTEADEFAFVLESDGLWHLADVGPILKDGLTVPLSPPAPAP